MKAIKRVLLISLIGLAGFSTASFASLDMSNIFNSNWLVRIRAISVIPVASSSAITTIGGTVNVTSQAVPELDISYFFTKNIAAELILATSKHDATAVNTALGTVNLGSVYALPPTLTAQYHFAPDAAVDPYLGVGINYTHFYNVKTGPVASSIKYKDSFGPAVQAGVDVHLNKHWCLNADFKKIIIRSDVDVVAGGATLKTKVDIDPVVIGFGVGYHT